MIRKYCRNCFDSNMKKKTGLNECVYDFSIDYKTFDTSNIIDIHKNLMETHDLKLHLGYLKNVYQIID